MRIKAFAACFTGVEFSAGVLDLRGAGLFNLYAEKMPCPGQINFFLIVACESGDSPAVRVATVDLYKDGKHFMSQKIPMEQRGPMDIFCKLSGFKFPFIEPAPYRLELSLPGSSERAEWEIHVSEGKKR